MTEERKFRDAERRNKRRREVKREEEKERLGSGIRTMALHRRPGNSKLANITDRGSINNEDLMVICTATPRKKRRILSDPFYRDSRDIWFPVSLG